MGLLRKLVKNPVRGLAAVASGGQSEVTLAARDVLMNAITPKVPGADTGATATSDAQLRLQEGQANLLQELVESSKQTRADAAALSEEAKKEAEAGRKRDAIFTPLLLKSLGYSGEFDADGNLSGIRQLTEEELVSQMSPLEKQQYQVAQELSSRQLKALRGELEVDPALTKDIERNRAILEEQLSRTLGPNWQQTTVGQQAFQDFQERATRITDSARRGEISQGVSLISSALDNTGKVASAGRIGAAESVAEAPFSKNLARKTAALAPTANAAAASFPLLSAFTQAQSPFQGDKAIAANLTMQHNQQQFEANQARSNFVKDLFGTAVGVSTSIATKKFA